MCAAKKVIPEYFYVFVDNNNLQTKWNFNLRGVFSSSAFTQAATGDERIRKLYLSGEATYLPYILGKPSVDFVSPYLLTAIQKYRIEYDAEICRYSKYSTLPSRMSAVFAFGDINSCEMAAQRYGWDIGSVNKFRLLEHDLNRIARVNMEIVSLASLVYRHSSLDQMEIQKYWTAYWSGVDVMEMEIPGAEFGSRKRVRCDVIWEYLIEGALMKV